MQLGACEEVHRARARAEEASLSTLLEGRDSVSGETVTRSFNQSPLPPMRVAGGVGAASSVAHRPCTLTAGRIAGGCDGTRGCRATEWFAVGSADELEPELRVHLEPVDRRLGGPCRGLLRKGVPAGARLRVAG